jgi:hypothetical protein
MLALSLGSCKNHTAFCRVRILRTIFPPLKSAMPTLDDYVYPWLRVHVRHNRGYAHEMVRRMRTLQNPDLFVHTPLA